MRAVALVLSLGLLVPVAGSAQSVGPLVLPDSEPKAAAAADSGDTGDTVAPRMAEVFGIAPLAVLPSAERAAPRHLEEIRVWNQAGRLPVRNAFARPLPSPRSVSLTSDLLRKSAGELAGGTYAHSAFDRLAWGAEVRVDGAYRLRLHLAGVRLPEGARLWVHGDGESVGPFGLDLLGPEGDLWTPSVAGEAVRLDVELPVDALAGGDRFGFVIDRVAEVVPLGDEGLGSAFAEAVGPCNVDGTCVGRSVLDSLDTYRRAVARLHFMNGNQGYLCSGGLLNDADPRTTVPYLLTANHCLQTQEEAVTLEAYWDYFTDRCNGTAPGLSRVPRSQGADLLATSQDTDFTLLRLRQIPRGRTFLGWNADGAAVAEGTLLHRLSHPSGQPQSYAATVVVTRGGPSCATAPRPRFVYSSLVHGDTAGGSSGAPVVLSNGQVAGQLLGGCGAANTQCDPQQYTLDGSFAQTYDAVRGFLDPPRACRPGPDTLCLGRNRFRVQMTWQDAGSGLVGTGQPLIVRRNETTGLFHFGDPANPELIVRVVPSGDSAQVVYSPLTDRRFTVSVTDNKTGEVRRFDERPESCGQVVSPALAGSRKAGRAARNQGTCVARPDTLCLLGRRLRAQVNWSDPDAGKAGKGTATLLNRTSGLFAFGDRNSPELVVKAAETPEGIRIAYGALSGLEYTVTVTDTVTGEVTTYTNPAGRLCGGGDPF